MAISYETIVYNIFAMGDTPDTSVKIEEAKTKLQYSVNHLRVMQQNVKHMFQFCCILAFGFSLYKLSLAFTSVSDIFNMVVSLGLTLTVRRNVMTTRNWTKLFLGLITVCHLLLFILCVPVELSETSELIFALLQFRARHMHSFSNSAICYDVGKQLPLSFVLYIVIYLSDNYMEKTYRQTKCSYDAMVSLAERLEAKRIMENARNGSADTTVQQRKRK